MWKAKSDSSRPKRSGSYYAIAQRFFRKTREEQHRGCGRRQAVQQGRPKLPKWLFYLFALSLDCVCYCVGFLILLIDQTGSECSFENVVDLPEAAFSYGLARRGFAINFFQP